MFSGKSLCRFSFWQGSMAMLLNSFVVSIALLFYRFLGPCYKIGLDR